MHRPGDTEVEDDAAFQTDERRSEIVHVKALGVGLGFVIRAGAEIIGGVARHRQGLGIADGVEHAVQRVAADIAHRADARGLLLDEGGVRDAATTAAAGLDVVDLAENAAFYDLFDHLHVLVQTGLEADGEHLAALLFRAHDLHRFFGGHAHGLLQQNVDALFQRINGAGRMLRVVGADADRIQLLAVEHGLVVGIELAVLDAVTSGELLGLAGNQIRHGHDLDVLHALVGLNVGFGNPAGADDADAELVFVAHLNFFFNNRLSKLAQDFIAFGCHESVPPLSDLRDIPPQFSIL